MNTPVGRENVISAGNQQERLSWLEKIPNHLGWYFSGFIDGEGSFSISIKKIEDNKLGWRFEPRFNVAQRDVTVLKLMYEHMGCGWLQMRSDGVHYFNVTDLQSIHQRVVPFCEKYYFLSESKEKNFRIFRDIIVLMVQKRHLTPNGFTEIIQLREKLNEGKGRKRKYTIENVAIKESSEIIRQRLIS